MAPPVLHFSHANGFPAPCYAAMLAPLRRHYRVGWIEAIGTDPRYPPTEGWPLLVEQLLDALERDYGGEDSDVLRRVGMRAMRGPRFLKLRVAGGHLFPFEQLLAAAAAVGELFARLPARS